MKKIGEVECGHCVMIVSGDEIFIGEGKDHQLNKKPWSQIKAESVIFPSAESYAPLATYIINSCRKMGCDSSVEGFRVKLNSLNGISGAIKNP